MLLLFYALYLESGKLGSNSLKLQLLSCQLASSYK